MSFSFFSYLSIQSEIIGTYNVVKCLRKIQVEPSDKDCTKLYGIKPVGAGHDNYLKIRNSKSHNFSLCIRKVETTI